MNDYKLFLMLLFCVPNACAFEWPQSTPEAEGVDSSGINQAIEMIRTGDYGDIRSLVIIKNGNLITQEYFNDQGGKAPVYSITKSIGSLLLGIAQHQGNPFELNDSMMDYMPLYQDINDLANKQNISLHDLLSQRHGLDWDELSVPYETSTNPLTIMLATSDWYRTVLEWLVSDQPDNKFAYSTGASSLMSVVLKTLTSQSPQEFINEHLFQPLDIDLTDTHWEIVSANGSQGSGISDFPQNLAPLGFGLWMKPIDLAKIGQLYLNKGVWQSTRLLSESWVDKSTFPYSNGVTDSDFFGSSNTGYGYQWWTTVFNDNNNRSFNSYYADGFGRQFIFVFPEIDMVVVSTARDFTYTGAGIGTLLRNQLLPAVVLDSESHLEINKNIDGAWYWPENSGQGFTFEYLPQQDAVLGFWYTYEKSNNTQRWFVMQGEVVDNKALLTITTTTGGTFVISQPPQMIEWGQAELYFDECNRGTFQFNSLDENVSGEIPLTRITGGENCQIPISSNQLPTKIFVR